MHITNQTSLRVVNSGHPTPIHLMGYPVFHNTAFQMGPHRLRSASVNITVRVRVREKKHIWIDYNEYLLLKHWI